MPAGPRPSAPERVALVEEILRRRRAGTESCEKIGRALGISKNTVVGICRRNGLGGVNPEGALRTAAATAAAKVYFDDRRAGYIEERSEEMAAIKAAWLKGQTARSIAYDFGISLDRLDRLVDRQGWPKRPKRVGHGKTWIKLHKKSKPLPAAEEAPPPAPAVVRPVVVRTEATCLYPFELKTGRFRYCGAEALVLQSGRPSAYCAKHHAACHIQRKDLAA
jgi:hypothetical protein